MFRSPTSTPQDEAAAKALAALAGEDSPTYAEQMFEAGADLTGRDAEDVFCSDFKVFSRGDAKFGVGQSIYMTDKSRAAAEALVGPFLPEASRPGRADTCAARPGRGGPGRGEHDRGRAVHTHAKHDTGHHRHA